MSAYVLLRFVHVLLAIVAVGFNASYGIWLARAARDPAHLGHVLRGVKTLDDRFANPAYVLLLVTGLAMVLLGAIPITTFWIATALGLYALLVLIALVVYAPTLRAQIRSLEARGADSAEYRRLAGRGTRAGIALGLLVLAIVFLMVTKPAY